MSKDDFIHRLAEGPTRRQRLASAIEDTARKARESTYGIQSIDGTIQVAMDGYFRIRGMAIDPEAYEDTDPDRLADTVVQTYNLARQTVHSKQIACMLDPLAAHNESSS